MQRQEPSGRDLSWLMAYEGNMRHFCGERERVLLGNCLMMVGWGACVRLEGGGGCKISRRWQLDNFSCLIASDYQERPRINRKFWVGEYLWLLFCPLDPCLWQTSVWIHITDFLYLSFCYYTSRRLFYPSGWKIADFKECLSPTEVQEICSQWSTKKPSTGANIVSNKDQVQIWSGPCFFY